MRTIHTIQVGLLACLTALGALACGPDRPGALALKLRFAQIEQAQTGQGLPPDLLSLRVDASAADQLLDSTDCKALKADAPARQGLDLDVTAGTERTVLVQGWANATCSGEPGWRGVAYGVDVIAGEEQSLAIFVTQLGTRLNSLHAPLPAGRAFATATPLPRGRVLIAGGFDTLEQTGSAASLQAACTALIYDAGSGAIERVVPMKACRGLHQAVALPDGRVLVAGGASRATFDPRGASRPMLRPVVEELLASAEVYDPETGSFQVQTDPLLARALCAAAARANGDVITVGGRTADALRTNQVLGATADGLGFSWRLVGAGLSAPRSGARAVNLDGDVLVAGGNPAGSADLELVVAGGPQVDTVQVSGDQLPSLARTGHGLDALEDQVTRLVLSGGTPDAAGQPPQADLLWGTWQAGQTLALTRQAMAKARAYHATGWLKGQAGDARLVLVGGLSDQLNSNRDLELAQLSGGGQVLSETLLTGAIGVGLARLPDGSLLLVGGLDVAADGVMSLSSAGQVLTP